MTISQACRKKVGVKYAAPSEKKKNKVHVKCQHLVREACVSVNFTHLAEDIIGKHIKNKKAISR